jgi:hypothetical protein
LTENAERTLRRVAVFAVFVIAAAAAVLSFNGLRNLALEAGIPFQLAWIFPVIVDGLTLVGSLGVVHAVLSGLRSWYPWTLTMIGVGLSVWGNVASSPPGITAQIVHAIPPVVLALSLEALLKVYRYRAVAGYLDDNAVNEKEHIEAADFIQHAPTPGEAPARRPVSAKPETVPQPQKVTHVDKATVSRTGFDHVTKTDENVQQSGFPKLKGTTREMLRNLVKENPNITPGEAAKTLGKDRSNVSKVLKEIKSQL